MRDFRVAISSIAASLLIALVNHPSASLAQSAQAKSCTDVYDACRDDCVHLGVIKAECFTRCKRRLTFCSTKELLSPARLNPFGRRQAAPSPPSPSHVGGVE